ncbi:hypothetical protein H6G96_30510 [Nostoc sp. FACHB-892]|uniref:hypothetical protein n=1 Tax=Nostoc sp. FACHB-892 TaxID=2692843 RepID=UPI001685F7E1|nr:hypothetical protein [Nostoc sp. FACHB-892]MBD2730532.1 hypothetical protein [Nostoc sp. FACHB-892]
MIIVCCYGCLWGAVIGIATLFIKPSETVAAIGLGFTAGVSCCLTVIAHPKGAIAKDWYDNPRCLFFTSVVKLTRAKIQT